MACPLTAAGRPLASPPGPTRALCIVELAAGPARHMRRGLDPERLDERRGVAPQQDLDRVGVPAKLGKSGGGIEEGDGGRLLLLVSHPQLFAGGGQLGRFWAAGHPDLQTLTSLTLDIDP